jgi:hypothetical protein
VVGDKIDLLGCAKANIKLEYVEKTAESLVALLSYCRPGAAPRIASSPVFSRQGCVRKNNYNADLVFELLSKTI